MREYRIIRNDLGWCISRKKEVGRLIMLQYLNGHNLWASNKTLAKTFYNKEDAVSALVLVRRKDEKKSD